MANLQYYFFPTDFYYPRPSKTNTQTNVDERQAILPAENPSMGKDVREHGDDQMKDAADKNSTRVKATSFGMNFVPANKQILGLTCRREPALLFQGLMNSKLSRQVPDKYRDNQISNFL
ncbi:hypothetical protein F511_02446 [Dorcoceras hygrometricum]|nr:hypothetical protein F511_02446 [Dorcoceras hygrometricum]